MIFGNMEYAREIDSISWKNKPSLDAVSVSDLQTKDNEISVWEVNATHSNIDDVALAVMMRRDRVCEVNMVLIDSVEVANVYRIQMHQTLGNSIFTQMNGKHSNFVVPTFWEMGYLTEYIQDRVKSDLSGAVYYSEPKMKILLKNAFTGGRISADDIKDKAKLKKALKALGCVI